MDGKKIYIRRMKKMLFLSFLICLFSCGGTTHEKRLSNSVADLDRHLDFSAYHPSAVKFEYTFTDNSKGPLTGPSDSTLEAVLYFDPETFRKLADEYKNVDYTAPGMRASDFNFKWLDKELQDELAKSPPGYTGHPDVFFTKSNTAVLWLLDNKVLLRHYVD